MPAKAEGRGFGACAGDRLLLARELQPMRETNPDCSVFEPKDEEKTDMPCFCCIHELVLTFRLPLFLCYEFATSIRDRHFYRW